MVCARCIDVVRAEIEAQGLIVTDVRLGEVKVRGPVSAEQLKSVRSVLEHQGFSLLTDVKAATVQQVKEVVEKLLCQNDLGDRKIRFSELITQQIPMDYDALSALFSAQEGITLEKYIINRRLDKVRELLVYTDLPLADIAYQTGFSSAPHLSNQFKRLTGLSPAYFRTIRRKKLTLQQTTQ
ncbi:hypothetical protein GCM10027190_26360 [Spirosoma areae]